MSKKVEKTNSKNNPNLFAEKVKAAYSQMGKLGGMARAKQMAERGFQPKASSQLNEKKIDKTSSKKST